jgi:hypothetical protein
LDENKRPKQRAKQGQGRLVVAKRLDCGRFTAAFGARRNGCWFVRFRPPESAAQADAFQTLRDFWSGQSF